MAIPKNDLSEWEDLFDDQLLTKEGIKVRNSYLQHSIILNTQYSRVYVFGNDLCVVFLKCVWSFSIILNYSLLYFTNPQFGSPYIYASLSSGDAHSDRQLTPTFDLWHKFFCVDMFSYADSGILSVCPYPDKRNHHCFGNISPTAVNDTSMEMSSRVLQHGITKNWFF